MPRASTEYGGCSLVGSATPRAVAVSSASRSWTAENVEVPMARTLPAATSSPSTSSVSPIGVSGSGRCSW